MDTPRGAKAGLDWSMSYGRLHSGVTPALWAMPEVLQLTDLDKSGTLSNAPRQHRRQNPVYIELSWLSRGFL